MPAHGVIRISKKDSGTRIRMGTVFEQPSTATKRQKCFLQHPEPRHLRNLLECQKSILSANWSGRQKKLNTILILIGSKNIGGDIQMW